MLIRTDRNGRWLVAQPAHAWVSGQLALAWGNDQFSAPDPRADVVLGTLLHDIGWLEWEISPTFNPGTGLPHSFMELPTSVHLDIWEPASRLALPFGRYAALLVSLHGTYLYGFHDYDRDTPDEADRARAFVARERAFQQACIASLREHETTASSATDAALERNRRFVALWDGMSLAICGGSERERTFSDIAARDGSVDLRMIPGGDRIILDPWPLSVDELPLRVDARALDRSFSNQAELDAWMATSKTSTFEVRLVRNS
jgi:hypothetical protein